MAGGKYCYLDVTLGSRALERIVVELFVDVAPKTCENFRTICLGDKAEGGARKVPGSDKTMTYKGSIFHRVIREFMLQGGDFTNGDGTGGVSIFGAEFEDENFDRPCDAPGLLCMANRGPNTNGSQFFITVAPTPHLTGKHVVFGKVVRGMNAVRHIEHTPTGQNDRPRADCRIVDCGTLEELPAVKPNEDGDVDPDYPEDCETPLSDADKIEVGERVRQVGNKAFLAQQYELAIDKYEKALRYLASAIPTSAAGQAIKDKKLACHNNAAQCYLKLEKWADARDAAANALDIDGSNNKARFRRGTALIGLGDYDDAVNDLKACAEAEPGNADVAAKLQFAREQQQKRKEKLAAGYRKMFS